MLKKQVEVPSIVQNKRRLPGLDILVGHISF